MAALPFAGEERRDGVVALSYTLGQMAALFLMCDRHDLGVALGDNGQGEARIERGPAAARRRRPRPPCPATTTSRRSSSTTPTPAASASPSRSTACTTGCSRESRRAHRGVRLPRRLPVLRGPGGRGRQPGQGGRAGHPGRHPDVRRLLVVLCALVSPGLSSSLRRGGRRARGRARHRPGRRRAAHRMPAAALRPGAPRPRPPRAGGRLGLVDGDRPLPHRRHAGHRLPARLAERGAHAGERAAPWTGSCSPTPTSATTRASCLWAARRWAPRRGGLRDAEDGRVPAGQRAVAVARRAAATSNLVEVAPGHEIVLGRLRVTAIAVPHRDELSDTVGYRVRGPVRPRLLYVPDIDKWEKWDRRARGRGGGGGRGAPRRHVPRRGRAARPRPVRGPAPVRAARR